MAGNAWVLLAVSLISGWFSGDLDIHIRFDRIDGLKTQARVFFEKDVIGKVTDVLYEKDGTYRVDVTIKGDFKKAVTQNSRFFIVNDPTDKTRKAIEMIRLKGEAGPLKDGAEVKGTTRLSALMERLDGDMSDALGDLKRRFKEFSEGLKEVPGQEDLNRLQEDLDLLLEEMKRSGSAFRDKVQKDLVPRLQEGIDKLRERLRKLGREKETEPLQTKMDEIRRI